MTHSFQGSRFLTSYLVFWCLIFTSAARAGSNDVKPILLVPVGALPNTDLQDLYKALKTAGSTPAPKVLRQGLSGDVPTSQPLATQPDAVRVKLLEARTHYENLETEPLKHVLQEVRGLLGALPNPFLYRDLLGAYFLLRAESALVEEDVRAAEKELQVYRRAMGEDASINAGFYTPTLRTIFSELPADDQMAQGTLRIRFPVTSLENVRVSIDLQPQDVSQGTPFETPLSAGRHILSLSAAHMLPQVRFIDVSPEQVSEISWWPQRPNAASLRAAWQEKHNDTEKITEAAMGEFHAYQPGVDLLFVGEAVDVFWHSGQTSRLDEKENTQAWATQITRLQQQPTVLVEPAAEGQTRTPWLLVGGVVGAAALAGIVYWLNQEPVVITNTVEEGQVLCFDGD